MLGTTEASASAQTQPSQTTAVVAPAKPKRTKKRKAKVEPAAEAAPPATKVKAPKSESWSDHFKVTEVTPGGHTVELPNSRVHLVDIRSSIVIERTSTVPETIRVRSGDEEHKKHFGVKVFAQRVDDNGDLSNCDVALTVPGLNRRTRRPTRPYSGCVEPTTYNLDTEVKHGQKFEIDTAHLRHGDRVRVELRGNKVGSRLVEGTDSCKPDQPLALDGSASTGTVCSAAKVDVPGRTTTIEFIVYDFQQAAPYERAPRRVAQKTGSAWIRHTGRGDRFDLDRALSVWFEPPDSRATFPALEARTVLSVKATAKRDGDDPRDVPCPANGRMPTCTGFNDGEAVTIIVSRPITVEGKEVQEEVTRYELEAAGLGLHYLPAGNHRAYYSTASLFAIEWDGDTPLPTFAQTIGYSMYWKSRDKRWVEGISWGAHVAVLGDPDESGEDAEDDDDSPASFGVGGQLGIGRDALQIGGGYDVLNRRPYFSIGIGIPDAVALMKRLQNRNQSSANTGE